MGVAEAATIGYFLHLTEAALTGGWVPNDIRDAIVDYTKEWSDEAEIPLKHFISWLVVSKSKFYNWIERYGKANEHNVPIPRDFWLAFWKRGYTNGC